MRRVFRDRADQPAVAIVAGGNAMPAHVLDLLKQLADSNDKVERKLSPEAVANDPVSKIAIDESSFRFLVNDDAMRRALD